MEDTFDIPIVEVKDVVGDHSVGIILGLNQHNAREIKVYLSQRGFPDGNIIDGGNYLENGGERLGFAGDAIMEITVRIGCSIHCRFCPQDLLLKNYYKGDKNRASVMTLDTFRECLEKIPKNVGIVFSGFAEPLSNPECMKMMELACSEKRNVDLFTTLVGADMETVKKISALPLNYVGLHCADKYGHAKIPADEDYYEKVKFFLSCKKRGTDRPLVDFCNTQVEPNERIAEIISGKYEVGTALFDRAGNLEGEGLVRKKNLHGRLKCSMCGELTNRNVLLPDGTVVLCCMDYGLMHLIGNLKTSTYEEVQNGKESQRIRDGLNGNEDVPLLCRSCSCAREVA
ncbi:MAG: SPASM domain-containing protein [Lachnospiraceae bacterium]|nr:SPASM domain-containing protein [Lachnospiraceae bacterium]